MLNVLDLFSGIGGFSLGLERTGGFKTVAFCEIEPFCRAVLRKHWPKVPIFNDVRALTATDVPGVDVICGGFPCQDISTAGNGAGIQGKRSGLWKEYARLVGEIRPQYVLVENVAALLGRGIDVVLGDLAALGYGAEWHCISASNVGAPHERDRVWIVAYPDIDRLEKNADQDAIRAATIYRICTRRLGEMGIEGQWDFPRPIGARPMGMDNGIPSDVDRLRALGNAVVPQIPEIIGMAILEAESLI